MNDYVEAFVLSCIEEGWDVDSIIVALEDKYGLSSMEASMAVETYLKEDD